MIERKIKNDIEKSLKNFPIIAILGPRQVGKTTLAKEIAKHQKSVYLDLELPSDLNKLSDPELYFKQYENELIIIDEIQRMPELFMVLRSLVDQKIKNGRFLLLGSSSLELVKNSSETLAGRIKYHELTGFSLEEVGYSNIQKLWMQGAFPKSYLSNEELSIDWREAFIKTYLERDIPSFGINISTITLRKFWTMIAHSQGQVWNGSNIADSLGVSAPTVKHYLDILEQTFVTRALSPYFNNLKKRLIKSPKIYIRDTGLLHILLNTKTFDVLQGHPVIGHSWETFVIEQIINIIPTSWKYYFYRTSAGAELDLMLITDKNKKIGIEIKYSLSPKPSKGFFISCDDINADKSYIIYPGDDKYQIKQNTIVLPAKMIGEVF